MNYYKNLKNNKRIYFDPDGYFRCEKDNESYWSHSRPKTREKYRMIESVEKKTDSNGDKIETVTYRITKVRKNSKLKCVCGRPLFFKGYHAWLVERYDNFETKVLQDKWFKNRKTMLKWFNSFD